MNKNAMVHCASCGQKIAKTAKVCPHCGAKNKQRPKKWWIAAIVIIVIIIIAVAAQGDGETDRPQTSGNTTATATATQSSAATEKATEAPAKPAIEYIEISATELIDAYDANEVAADKKYKGQWLSVSGTVKSIGVTLGSTYVTLVKDGEWSLTDVQCFVTKDTIDAVSELLEGDIVTFQGKCGGKSLNISLNDSIIAK
jgi:predicted nucleic acid-binding Zn ribbon protein